MILGAYQGEEALPKDWLSDMKKYSYIDGLLG
jgi:hypothetical protein